VEEVVAEILCGAALRHWVGPTEYEALRQIGQKQPTKMAVSLDF
jgi:hypothetical protein